MVRVRWRFAWGVCLAASLAFSAHGAEQITADTADQDWSNRNPSTKLGTILWTDGSDVFFYDGATITTVQQRNDDVPRLSGGIDTGTVFMLGSGAEPDEALAAWRRGNNGDYAWIWSSVPAPNGSSVEVIDPENPFQEGARHNPEGVDVANGHVFMALQAFFNGNGVKHLFKIDAATGQPFNLSGTDPIQGVSRVSTSGGQAAWVKYPDSFADPDDEPPLELWFFDGVTATLVDTGEIDSRPRLNGGVLVYTKIVSGVSQVFVYDARDLAPAAMQITDDVSGGNFYAQTDGWRVAWFRGNADQSNLHLMLLGEIQVSDVASQPQLAGNPEVPLQMADGQLLWTDTQDRLRYETGTNPTYDGYATTPIVDISPALTVQKPWLADGHIVWLGLSDDGGTDKEVFVFEGMPPSNPSPPPPLLVLAEPGNTQAMLRWDLLVGVDSYNVYFAAEEGVTADNFETLREGTKIAGASSPLAVTGLANNRPYAFVVTAVRDGVEGPESRTAWVTPFGGTFAAATNLEGIDVRAVAANPTEPLLVYAAGATDVYVSMDGGAEFTGPATGEISGRAIRALAARGQRVLAATQDGDLLRSENAGVDWSVVADGENLGEINKSLLIDPGAPLTVYAGNFQLSSYNFETDSFVIKSVNGGATWSHLPQIDVLGGEIRAYAIAVDSGGNVYAGGTGTPNLVKSLSGGNDWLARAIPGLNAVYGLAVDPFDNQVLYAATNGLGFPQINGVFKSVDAAAAWESTTNGLPESPGFMRTILADPDLAQVVYVGGDDGVFYTPDGGNHWVPRMAGLGAKGALSVYGLAITPQRRLLAATSSGLFTLDLAEQNRPPVLTNPGAQANTESDVVSLSIEAVDPDDDPLSFAAQGLPTGLSINEVTGVISGTISTGSSGTYDVTVGVTDGELDDSAMFEWSITAPLPAQASNPMPPNGATGQPLDVQLSWTPGAGAISHDVYFGASNPPPFVGNQSGTGLTVGPLASGTTYFWRVDEVNAGGTAQGLLWQFTTVSQTGLSVGPSSLAFGCAANEKTILVNDNGGAIEWQVSVPGGENWITVSVAKGQNGEEIQVTCLHNPEDSPREALVRIQVTNMIADPIDVPVTQGRQGDLDGDGATNAVDVQITINGVLGLPTSDPADVNGDGIANAVDVQLVINTVLGL